MATGLKSDSLWENPNELEIGTHLPPPFSRLYIREFLRRTESGGWLYALGKDEVTSDESDSK